VRPRVDLARGRTGAPAVLVRPRPSICGGPAPRRRPRGFCRDSRARTRGRGGLVRRNRADRRQDRLDPDRVRLHGHTRPPRLDPGRARRRRRGRVDRRSRRAERRHGPVGTVRLFRRAPDKRSPGICRSAEPPASASAAGGRASSHSRSCSARCCRGRLCTGGGVRGAGHSGRGAGRGSRLRARSAYVRGSGRGVGGRPRGAGGPHDRERAKLDQPSQNGVSSERRVGSAGSRQARASGADGSPHACRRGWVSDGDHPAAPSQAPAGRSRRSERRLDQGGGATFAPRSGRPAVTVRRRAAPVGAARLATPHHACRSGDGGPGRAAAPWAAEAARHAPYHGFR
jgi:hypothetical protein